MQAVLEQNLITDSLIEANENALGDKIGIFGKLFGCWHKRLARPITRNRVSYQACLECGARRKFDTERFRTSGPFYYPPSVMADPFRRIT